MSNPYDPQTPSRPEFFGGRENVLAKVRERIDSALVHGKSGGILVFGHRGVGKTSLLKKIIDELEGSADHPSNVLIIYRRLGRTTNDQELYSIMNEEITSQIQKRKTRIERLSGLAHFVDSVKIFEIEVGVNHGDAVISAYQKWKQLTASLKNADYIFVAIDDADFLSTEAIGELKTIVEDTQDTPLILAISGGIEFAEKLVDKYSPVARIFSGADFNIGKFELVETTEVLEKPLVGTTTTWEVDAIRELHSFTSGYPYLVQCLAMASYVENGVITKDKVRASIHDAVAIGRSWLDHEIPRASDQDVVSFAKIAKLGKNVLQSVEISAAGVSPPYIGRLVSLKVLKQVSRGRYSLQKSPMIATYEVLKRGLQV